MLKTQFTRAFYLCNSFLLIAVPFTADPVNNLSVSSQKENYGHKMSLNDTRDNLNGNISLVRMNILKNKSSQFNFGKPQILLNKNEMLFARKYIKNSGDCLVGVKKRSLIPFNIIDSVFNRYGLPVELKYLAVIESELKPMALSRVGARGPWQMMPATARILGLKTTYQCDERTNYYKSTIAAARYLRIYMHYLMTGCWYLPHITEDPDLFILQYVNQAAKISGFFKITFLLRAGIM